jgi:hypothetical protein
MTLLKLISSWEPPISLENLFVNVGARMGKLTTSDDQRGMPAWSYDSSQTYGNHAMSPSLGRNTWMGPKFPPAFAQ